MDESDPYRYLVPSVVCCLRASTAGTAVAGFFVRHFEHLELAAHPAVIQYAVRQAINKL